MGPVGFFLDCVHLQEKLRVRMVNIGQCIYRNLTTWAKGRAGMKRSIEVFWQKILNDPSSIEFISHFL